MKALRNISFCIVAVATIFLSACSYTPGKKDQRIWSDIDYPQKTVQLEILNNKDMSPEDAQHFRDVLVKALNDLHINVAPNGKETLTVEIVTFNEQSALTTFLRWSWPGPWVSRSSNALDLRAYLTREDGSKIEFTKLREIKESARKFDLLVESLARRVAFFVRTAEIREVAQM